MVERTKLWSQLQAAQTAIVQNLSPKLQAALQDSIFNGVQGWFHLGLAYYIRPDALTVERLQQRNPYTHRDILAQQVQNLHDADFLDDNGTITQNAYDAYQSLIDAQNIIAQELDLMLESELKQLAHYLTQAHDATKTLDAPCFKDVSTLRGRSAAGPGRSAGNHRSAHRCGHRSSTPRPRACARHRNAAWNGMV
jgi:hypothetical protein